MLEHKLALVCDPEKDDEGVARVRLTSAHADIAHARADLESAEARKLALKIASEKLGIREPAIKTVSGPYTLDLATGKPAYGGASDDQQLQIVADYLCMQSIL